MKNPRVGDEVQGICSKVLQVGDYQQGDRLKLIRGTITAKIGSGRARRWEVKWENPSKSTVVTAQRLQRVYDLPSTPDADATLSSSSDDSDAESSDDEEAAIPAEASTVDDKLCPDGLKWSNVDSITENSMGRHRTNMRLNWPDNLPYVNRAPLDFFFLLFPRQSVNSILEHTNKALEEDSGEGTQPLTEQEFFLFIAMILAIAVYDFGQRRDYWSASSTGDVFPAPNLGRFGMGVNRFENILRNLRFAPHSDDRWCQPRAFVDAFNSRRVSKVSPSWIVTVDEKMSAYRPRKLPFLDTADSIPHLTKFIRKPEGVGTELKDCSDGTTCLCLRLEIQEGKEAMATKKFCGPTVNSGTAIVLRLVEPWFQTDRLVCGDSAFASVATALECRRHGLHFTGIVKTATKKYPKK